MSFVDARDIPFEIKIFWAAVLRRAIFDYVLYKGVRSKSLDWKRAYQYVFTPGLRYEDGVSFEEVCQLFSWDPDYLRRMTTKLTRDDIKKMEPSHFREEFVFDIVAAMVERRERWETSGFAVPFCPTYDHNDEYREVLALKTIPRQSNISTPLVKWSTVVA
jgi:hypothetical protein